MTEIGLLIPALLTGMMLGVIFFAGLWWTIQKGLTSAHPALWFLGSLLFRTAMTVSGFYLVSDGNWQKLLACLCGFLITRFTISHFTRLPITTSTPINKESHHAPES